MTSRTHHLPKYRHHKGRNLAKVCIDGREIYLGQDDKNHSLYLNAIARYERVGIELHRTSSDLDMDIKQSHRFASMGRQAYAKFCATREATPQDLRSDPRFWRWQEDARISEDKKSLLNALQNLGQPATLLKILTKTSNDTGSRTLLLAIG